MKPGLAKLETLQVLRGFAAVLIMAKHALYEVSLTSDLDFSFGNYRNYVLGIDIFFVLSGFIMVYTSQGRFGPAFSREFFLRRLTRIVPIYWFYTLLLVAVSLVLPSVLGKVSYDTIDVLKSLFFIPYINPVGDLQPFLANGWSLNYEMYFYLVFAVFVLAPPRYMLMGMTAFFLTSTALGYLYDFQGPIADFYTRPILLEFVAGAIIGYLFLSHVRLPAWTIWPGVAFMILAFLGIIFTAQLIEMGITYPRGAVATLVVIFLTLPKGLEHLSMPKPLVFLGDASYTIYLSHPFALGAVTQLVLIAGWQASLSPWLIFAACAAVSIFGGCAAYLLIEKPMQLSARRWLMNIQGSRQGFVTSEKI